MFSFTRNYNNKEVLSTITNTHPKRNKNIKYNFSCYSSCAKKPFVLEIELKSSYGLSNDLSKETRLTKNSDHLITGTRAMCSKRNRATLKSS